MERERSTQTEILPRTPPNQEIGSTMPPEDDLTTESRNPASDRIDELDAIGIVHLMNREDARVVDAVGEVAGAVAEAVALVADAFKKGGRLIYVGAGTSGRLGVLDASEWPADVRHAAGNGGRDHRRGAFGADPIDRRGRGRTGAGGGGDRRDGGSPPGTSWSASRPRGGRPFVLGAAVDRARELGAATVGIACNSPSLLGGRVGLEIAPIVGPEILAGSTRLKSGTATKMILNMMTTGAMILLGKTFGNRMIDLQPSNRKLQIRTRRILRELGEVDDDRASALLGATGGRLKPALVMAMAGVDAAEAERRLAEAGGQVRGAIAAAVEDRGR